jgi:hypothetical protein
VVQCSKGHSGLSRSASLEQLQQPNPRALTFSREPDIQEQVDLVKAEESILPQEQEDSQLQQRVEELEKIINNQNSMMQVVSGGILLVAARVYKSKTRKSVVDMHFGSELLLLSR